jgi:hypothetical protein
MAILSGLPHSFLDFIIYDIQSALPGLHCMAVQATAIAKVCLDSMVSFDYYGTI